METIYYNFIGIISYDYIGVFIDNGQISTILPNLLPISGSFDPIKMAKLDGKLHRLDQELKNSHQKQQETLFQLQSQIDQLNNKIISIIDNQQQQQQQSSRNNEDKSTTTTNKKHEDIITLENNQIQISPEFHQFYINLLIIIKILILMKNYNNWKNLMIYNNYRIMLKN